MGVDLARWRMQRCQWRALLRIALGAVALQLYCAPRRVLEHSHAHVHAHEQFEDVLFLRMWLGFAVTLYALSGVISKQIVLVSLLHALIHFARSISDAPSVVTPRASAPLRSIAFYWQTSAFEACAYEYSALLTFALLLRYVLFPPPSALATFQRHSRNLKAFFAQHDREFVPLVDHLLEEYTGHERLLYARIRRLYCAPTRSSTSIDTTADAEPPYVSTTSATPAFATSPARAAAQLMTP